MSTAIDVEALNRPRNARELEQAIREWREETEYLTQIITTLCAMAAPTYVLIVKDDGTHAIEPLTSGPPPQLLETVNACHKEIRAAAERRGLTMDLVGLSPPPDKRY